MRLSRTALPLLLLTVVSACAPKAPVAVPESAASPASASGMVQLLNYDEKVRLLSSRFTPEMRRLYRGGYSVLELELDAGGAVTNSRYVRAGGGQGVHKIARELAPRMRFTRPAAAGQRVVVRMAYDRNGRPDVFLEQ